MRNEIKVNSPSTHFNIEVIDYNLISTDIIPAAYSKGIKMDILRLDKIHPLISGNKIFKLRKYIEEAIELRTQTIATFGGAWSNHILATAAACQLNKIKCIGYIRGEKPTKFSFTLNEAQKAGMKLVFLPRDEYDRKKREPHNLFNDIYFIPEGGYGLPGAEGAATIINYFNQQAYTHICCAAGTGTMTGGLIRSSLLHQQIISLSVLKNNVQLQADVESLTDRKNKKFTIIHDYHFGGYAKYNNELIDFMNSFYSQTGIPSDFVYTGKLFFGIMDLVHKKFFPSNSKIMVIHSGGLQGNLSLNNGTLIF